jgi:PAS domain S-box-containing protein
MMNTPSSPDLFYSNLEQNLLLLSNKLSFGVYRSSVEGQIFYANNAMVKMLEYNSFEELSSNNASSFYVDPEARLQKIEDLKSAGVNTFETKLKTSRGREIWVKDVSKAVFGSDNQILFIEGIWEDITEKKERAKELTEKTEFLNELIENVSQGIGLITPDYMVSFCNKSFAALFGVTPDKIQGNTILIYIGAVNMLIFENELDERKATSFEIMLNHLGKEKYIQVMSKPRYTADGEYAGAFLTMLDVTGRVTMENELIKARDKACEADQLKTTFLTNLSHEIRTPMNGVIGFATMLKNESLPEAKRHQYLDIMLSRSKHMMDLLNNIIDITKIEQGHLQATPANISVNDLILNLSHSFKNEIDESRKPIKISSIIDLPADIGEVWVESYYLQQILTHLFDNALKFTNEGFIEINCSLDNSSNQLQFAVKDSGIGVAKAHQRIIFERFRQVDESFTRQYGGMGLGLAICKGLVEHIGGKIWVESDGINGSTFFFTIPFTKSEVLPKKRPLPKSVASFVGHSVLVVEDDPASYEYVKEVLSNAGCRVIHAANGSEAMRIISTQKKFDLVLLDIQLPEMNGYEVAGAIRNCFPEVPIIAQTAHALSEDRKKCLASGCNEYLTKPIMYDVLLNMVSRYLG